VSSVTTHLVLTTRKALSLCFTVWYFSRGWSVGVGVGAAMVFLGSAFFGLVAKDGARDQAEGWDKDKVKDSGEDGNGHVRNDVGQTDGQVRFYDSKRKLE
jgi:hypothetical protein